MGTRADFYVGTGLAAEWLGSIAWDGYPGGAITRLCKAASEEEWRKKVAAFLKRRDDGTTPEKGWPWPWEDSRTTDYAYAFTPDGVVASSFGSQWFDPLKEQPDDDGPRTKTVVFPNMKDKQRVAFGGDRSGLIVLGG